MVVWRLRSSAATGISVASAAMKSASEKTLLSKGHIPEALKPLIAFNIVAACRYALPKRFEI